MKMFSFRAKENLIKEAEKLAALEKVERSTLLREALERGLAQLKLDIAIKLFAEGKMSIGEASNIADLSVGEIMEELTKRGIKTKIELNDINDGLKVALEEL